ncbi:hypothetical protein SpCBS45565_g03397 [Spizellomyces sp. 'palustris']|nr:hypothetical protein SpCBS45565_g03397 [Spizellomyces sp. 'palustris']
MAATICSQKGVQMQAQCIGPDTTVTMQGNYADVMRVVEALRQQLTVKHVEGGPMFNGVIIRATVSHGGIFKKASSGDLDYAFPIELAPSYQESSLESTAMNAAAHTADSVPMASSFALATTAIRSAVGVSSVTSAGGAAGSQFLERFISKKAKNPAVDKDAAGNAWRLIPLEPSPVRLAELQAAVGIKREETKQVQIREETKHLQLKLEHERLERHSLWRGKCIASV